MLRMVDESRVVTEIFFSRHVPLYSRVILQFYLGNPNSRVFIGPVDDAGRLPG